MSHISQQRGKATDDNGMMFAAMATTMIQLQCHGSAANNINGMLLSLP